VMEISEEHLAQFLWEMDQLSKDIEAFLAMNDKGKKRTESLHTMAIRLQVARARLRVFVETLRER
jgi:hypothetical protein